MSARGRQVVPVALEAYGGDAPLPPSLSTVTQMGLGGARGVPSLLAAALPEGTPAPSRDWLRRLLLLPPPPTVAEDIRAVCQQLAGSGEGALPVPPLVTSVPGPRIAALLAEGAAGHNTMRELRGAGGGHLEGRGPRAHGQGSYTARRSGRVVEAAVESTRGSNICVSFGLYS